jgi:hypothetical protein
LRAGWVAAEGGLPGRLGRAGCAGWLAAEGWLLRAGC